MKIKKSNLFLLCACLAYGQARAEVYNGTFAPLVATADPDDGTVTPFVAVEEQYNSNLFALPSEQAAQSSFGRRQLYDFWTTATAGTNIDWKKSKQELVGHVVGHHTDYRTYTVLDNTTHDVELRWKWRAGDLFRGDLGAMDKTQLGDLTYIQQPIHDIFTTRQFYFDGLARLADRWRLGLDARQLYILHSATSQQPFNLNVHTISGGPEYYTDTDKSVALVSQWSSGVFPNAGNNNTVPVTTSFTEYDNGIKFVWGYMGKMEWSGKLNYTRYINRGISSQSYSGPTGNLDFLWSMTGKTKLAWSAYRNVMLYNTSINGFQIVKGSSLALNWHARPQLFVIARVKLDLVDYLLNQNQSVQNVATRHDRISSAGLELDYKVLRHTRLVMRAAWGMRTSNTPRNSYHDTDVSLGLEQRF